MKTLKKQIKWRKDNQAIFICDCKRLVDLKIKFKYEDFMKKLNQGLNEDKLSSEEKLVLNDFKKMNWLSDLSIKQIDKKDFNEAMKILDEELGVGRVRDANFLKNKFKEFPEFFIGAFLDDQLIGIICGFPREDYLLLSELAVDSRFNGRGLGRKLVEAFEKANDKYRIINAGAVDFAVGFYSSMEYKPFLLIQNITNENLDEFEIIEKREEFAKIRITDFSKNTLENLRRKYPSLSFQYIFQKIMD